MRNFALALALVSAAPIDAAADVAADGEATVVPSPSPEAATGRSLPPAPLRMISEVPRWPFIAAACGVFVIMALLGLRRRRS